MKFNACSSSRRVPLFVTILGMFGAAVACGSSEITLGENASPIVTPDADAGEASDNACEAAGGACADGTTARCARLAEGALRDACAAGGPTSVCCLPACPMLSPPAPDFCKDDATPIPVEDASGCITGYRCPPENDCEAAGGACVNGLVARCARLGSGRLETACSHLDGQGSVGACCLPACQPPPPIAPCPSSMESVPEYDASGCLVGATCVTRCASVGGECRDPQLPVVCDRPAPNTAQYSCEDDTGGGPNDFCCLHACPVLSPPGPGFCLPGKTPTPIKDATGCVTGYDCK